MRAAADDVCFTAVPHTRRACRGDLIAFAAHHGEEIDALTAVPVRAFLAELAWLAPAGRKRERAAIVSFAKWAVRQELLQANPMDRIDIAKVPKSLPCSGRGRRRRQGAGAGMRLFICVQPLPAFGGWSARSGS
ncbi:site-specific integrase [Nonomuraea jabiensis]|uniref:Core-binding (CB) domain-containing protein n=1 Tax=Nonomuraea jabiensis TaxID=882448 RepID=A0A7W9LFX5_9ACTN|nr:site-specific integrase [Nonomuraea jabiensis]MBB5782335.1 hypothetical protein [Nonomuraea jabiensis]